MAMNELHVVFRVGEAEYALAADKVVQMESYDGATPVPGAAPYVMGIAQVRGRVVPVVDLRARFGLPSVQRTLDTRLVVGEDAGRSVALLVDSAREVVKVPEGQIEPPPRVLAHEAQGYVQAVARLALPPALDGQKRTRLLLIIDFQKVIGEGARHGG
jgi:purine-binding chemotaxis protein CheW